MLQQKRCANYELIQWLSQAGASLREFLRMHSFLLIAHVFLVACWPSFFFSGCILMEAFYISIRSKDVLMRVVAQNLSPELTLVEKVLIFSI